MKFIGKVFFLLAIIVATISCGQTTMIDLGEDNPDTLIGTNSTDYSIAGLRLGISHDEAWKVLERSEELVGEKDTYNPSRIYVYAQNADGSKGGSILYLVWEEGETTMSRITVFQDSRNLLSNSFKKLLSFEAIDNSSDFKKKFIGYANRSSVTSYMPELDSWYKTYFYDEIGLEIVHKQFDDSGEVIFALVKSNN